MVNVLPFPEPIVICGEPVLINLVFQIYGQISKIVRVEDVGYIGFFFHDSTQNRAETPLRTSQKLCC